MLTLLVRGLVSQADYGTDPSLESASLLDFNARSKAVVECRVRATLVYPGNQHCGSCVRKSGEYESATAWWMCYQLVLTRES